MKLIRKQIFKTVTLCFSLIVLGCNPEKNKDEVTDSIFNLSHLDALGEVVNISGQDMRIIHIYADAPDYNWVGDDDEGEACVDDAARAAVVYLRHFELTGNEESAEKAKQLLRFVAYMQTDEGYFYNFVWDNSLRINKTHQNSLANEVNWWAARAVWALGVGARVLANHDSSFASFCLTTLDKSIPKIEEMLTAYPETVTKSGYEMPTWLIGGTGSDASSELLLGLAEANMISPDQKYSSAISKLSEGISMLQYGNISSAPYGAHLSWEGGWHGWGNSQTMAQVRAGQNQSAIVEANNFYPWLLVNGWLHSFPLESPGNKRYYEQIAYATRGVTVGLVQLYNSTKNEKYAIMAGLAGSWFMGNNEASAKMYNSLHGYGFDGINSPTDVNKNSGAESTIEALYSVLELEQNSISKKWMFADSSAPEEITKSGKNYRYRVFTVQNNGEKESVTVIINMTDSEFELLDESEWNSFLDS